MSSDYIRDVLQESVNDPISFAELMRIRMSTAQRVLLRRLATTTGQIDIEADKSGDIQHAAILALFWRTLRLPLSTGLILAPKRIDRLASMEFVKSIRDQHHALQAVTHFKEPHWWRCEFGFRPQWQILAPTAIPEQLCAIESEQMTLLVLGGSTEMLPAVKMAQALASKSPASLVIQLW